MNGLGTRLPHLLAWLEREKPDIACLQELKATKFPDAEIRAAGYSALWHGQRSWNGVAILTRGLALTETRRGLPGDDADEQSRYLEANVQGLSVGCVYLPNGNPQPGPKFAYKLVWFERLIRHAQALWDSGAPVALVGDFNVVPTDEDIYDPRSWKKDALLQPESRECYRRLLTQGWMDSRPRADLGHDFPHAGWLTSRSSRGGTDPTLAHSSAGAKLRAWSRLWFGRGGCNAAKRRSGVSVTWRSESFRTSSARIRWPTPR